MHSATPLRVLLVQPSPVRGGAEESLLELLTRTERVRFTAACLSDGPYVDDLEAAGVDVVRLRAQRLRYPHMWALTVARLSRLAHACDAVLGWQVKANYYGTPAARIAGRPAVWWDHGIRPAKGEPRYLIDSRLPASTRADLVLTSSSASAVRHRRAKVILPGIPLGRFAAADRAEGRRRLEVDDDVIVLGVIGRLQPWKGIHHLIAALPAVRERHPKAIAVVVGSDVGGFSEGYPAELRRLAVEHQVAGAVRFLGQRDDVAQLLPGFDRFVQTSLAEPFGLVTVEAMAAGVPVIGTDAGGTPEIVADGETGALVPPDDPAALAPAIVASLDDPGRAADMAEAGRTHVLQAFAVERYVREIEETLIELVEANR